ncbi:MAG: L,D-transpeptidase [Elusimicrobia bacterium]|nr:L,D-transpeptidase [Elusimicrobiota bacterium]
MEAHEPRIAKHVYAGLLLAWLLAFAVEAAQISRWASALSAAGERLDSAGQTLSAQSRETAAIAKQVRGISSETEYLGNLPNILPQDKGYLRTQKAVSDEIQGLRRKLGRFIAGGLHIVIDAKTNKLYLKKGFKLLWQADCSVGRGGTLVDKNTGQRWEFVTPRGEFRVMGKGTNPEWRKPDWAYVEAGEPIPPPEDPVRLVQGELGAYVFNLGDGYLIHGTKDERVLGRPASHGCVRLGADDLKKLYETVPTGTRVFIY